MKVSIRKIVLVAFVAGLCGISASSFAQDETAMADHRLWGTWGLETVELTKDGVTKKYSLDVLLANKNNLPRNMFTSLYFFDDQIGVNSTETEFGSEVNLKGSFTAKDGILTVTIWEEQSRAFSYTIEGDFLKIRYTQAAREFYLIYKKNKK